MKAFSIAKEQIAASLAAIIADELGSSFARHIDTATAAGWNSATLLRSGGAELSEGEEAAVRRRAYSFFGIDEPVPPMAAETIGDWVAAIERAISARLTSFSFSGADEKSRAIIHRADAIFCDAAAAANLLYGRRRILSLVSPHSLIGFTLTVIAPNLLRTETIDVRGLAPGELKSFLIFGDALIATPSLWRYLVSQEIFAPDNAMAVFFGEALSADLAAAIRKAGFNAQREIYGSTEHGLIGWRDSPSDPFALFDHWTRQGDGLRRSLPDGEGIDVTPMDRLSFDGDRRFRLGGRRDGAVQIGAVNVFPDRIAGKIADHPDIKRCAIEVVKDDIGADRLIAMIELTTGRQPSESSARSIDGWCRSRLRPYERPRLYNYIGE